LVGVFVGCGESVSITCFTINLNLNLHLSLSFNLSLSLFQSPSLSLLALNLSVYSLYLSLSQSLSLILSRSFSLAHSLSLFISKFCLLGERNSSRIICTFNTGKGWGCQYNEQGAPPSFSLLSSSTLPPTKPTAKILYLQPYTMKLPLLMSN